MALILIGLAVGVCGKLASKGSPVDKTSGSPGASATPRAPGNPQPAYVLPAEIAIDAKAERGDLGEIVIAGSTNLPDGTKLGAEVPVGGGQDYSIFVANGQFRSVGFTDKGNPMSAGPRKVKLLAYFNGAWQTPAVRALVGEDGKNLRGKVIKLEDPTVTDSGKVIDLTITTTFPPVSGEASAVALTKKAILTVDGRRSATNIEDNIAYFLKSPGLSPGKGWSAKSTGGSKYTVEYSMIDGTLGEQPAIWAVDTASKKVTYVNTHAKQLSWLPAD